GKAEVVEPQPVRTSSKAELMIDNIQQVLKPGDVLLVHGSGVFGELIRLGSALANKPNLDGHVCFMHHWDAQGIPWGIEGRPGGVGYADMRPYINDPYMLNNCGQPGRSDNDRVLAASDAEAMLGTRYDWQAILGDAVNDISPVNLSL